MKRLSLKRRSTIRQQHLRLSKAHLEFINNYYSNSTTACNTVKNIYNVKNTFNHVDAVYGCSRKKGKNAVRFAQNPTKCGDASENENDQCVRLEKNLDDDDDDDDDDDEEEEKERDNENAQKPLKRLSIQEKQHDESVSILF